MTTTNVGIKLTLDGAAQAEAGLRRVQGGMDAIGNAADNVRGALQQLGGAFAGALSVRAFVQAADAVTVLQNQLKLATGSTQAATQAYTQLFEIAQRSRVSFTELGGTFASIARASESLGLSQQQLLRLTETIGNAVTVSGASAQASQAALVQLSQGLASGVLRGEELNSILEQTPRLARALADGLGVPIGKLRELGQAGELTAERVIGALQTQSKVLASEVQNSVVTVGQAFTQLQNSATVSVGQIDEVTGASKALASALQAASAGVQTLGQAFKENEVTVKTTLGLLGGAAAAAGLAALAGNLGKVTLAVRALGLALAANPLTLALLGIGAAAGAFVAYNSAAEKTAEGIAKTIRQLEELNQAAVRSPYYKGETDRATNALIEKRKQQIQELKAQLDSLKADDIAATMDSAGINSRASKFLDRQGAGENWKAAEEAARLEQERIARDRATKALNEYNRSVASGTKIYADFVAQQNGLSPDFADKWQDISNAYKAGKLSLEELTAAQAALLAQQPISKALADEQKAALEAQAKAAEELAKAEFERIEAAERSATSAQEQLQRLLDEERALVVAAEKNISLAQALEEVAIARLRERQAALMAEGDRDAEVLAIQKEIDARKQLVEAIGRKETRAAAADAAKDAAREWERTAENIERSLTDALMRGFESGKDFARVLRDTVVNMFQTMVLRPIIQAVVSPVAGALTGALGLPATANAGQLGNSLGLASGIKSVYDTIMGGFSALGDKVAFAAQEVGAWLVNNTTGVLNQAGGSLMSNAGTLGTVGSYLGGITAGLGLGSMISGQYAAFGNSNISNIAGTAIGAFFGGPIGAAIGGAIGGLVNRAFGRGPMQTTGTGITGTFSTDGASVQNYQEWFQKGGWFRSDKSGVNYSAVSNELDNFLDQSLRQVTMATKMYANVLGLNADAVNGITQSVKISLMGLNAEQQQQAVMKALGGFGDRLAEQLLGTFETYTVQTRSWFRNRTETRTRWVPGEFVRQGETAGEALARLANSLVTVNRVFDTLNQTLLRSTLVGGDAASSLLDVFGGSDAFTQATSAYYQGFYSEAERADTAARQLTSAFDNMGLVLPRTRAEFRALVESQNLYTESGRQTYAALLRLAPVFNEIQTAAESFASAFDAAVRGVFDSLFENVRRARQGVAASREGITGSVMLLPDQIQSAIQGALVTAPSLANLNAADARMAASQNSVNTLTGLSDAANAGAQQQLDGLMARRGELESAQQSLASLDSSRQARRNEFQNIWNNRIGKYWWRVSLGDVYRQEEAQYQQQASALQTRIAELSGAVAAQQAVYDAAASSAANYTQQLTAAKAALEAAQGAQQTAREQYAASVREYIAAASRSVETLSALRQSVVDYYESQRALADAMLGSAARLRDAAAQVRFGQLTPDQNAARLANQFQVDYSMALATTGTTRAQYADRLSDTLPQLSEALRSTASTQEEWILSTARLVAQSNTVAQLLEQSAPANYESESLALLDQIDAALATIQTQAASAEQVISDAIYETGEQNLVGLRAIVATLRGEDVPRFAAGGLHTGGVRLVGERGPELEVTGPARYWSHEQTRQMMQGGGNESANEIRALREENRAQARAMVQLQARFTKLLERWDAQGMPDVRVEA